MRATYRRGSGKKRPIYWPATRLPRPYPLRKQQSPARPPPACHRTSRPPPQPRPAAAGAPGRPKRYPLPPPPVLVPSAKAVYRQLARLHHPDRAAQDAPAAAQQTQTALMQRITAAYAAGDLAALLSLLAETAGPTPPPSPEAEDWLRRYTQALTQQYSQLSQELAAARRPDDDPWSGTEKQQRTRLRQLKRDLRAETDYLDYLVRQLREPAELRQLLRELAASGRVGF